MHFPIEKLISRPIVMHRAPTTELLCAQFSPDSHTFSVALATARVHVDRIAMSGWKLPLIGGRAIPLNDARPGHFQHILFRAMRKKIERHGRPIPLRSAYRKPADILGEPV
jgi:hypothetical protein